MLLGVVNVTLHIMEPRIVVNALKITSITRIVIVWHPETN